MKCIIWGAGEEGQIVKEYLLELNYEIYAFCDSKEPLHGKNIEELKIISPNDLCNICKKEKIQAIVIGTKNKIFEKEIQIQFRNLKLNDIQLLVENDVENMYLSAMSKKLNWNWKINFSEQSKIWIDHFMEEIEFWVECLAKTNGLYHQEYIERLLAKNFLNPTDNKKYQELADRLPDKSIILDIGCGLVSRHGKQYASKNFQLISIDPLAHYYNSINLKLGNKIIHSNSSKSKVCHWGLFEFIANSYDRNYADAIIIRNALDHCIDPYKSLIECLYILKLNGEILLDHRRDEAVFERYSGLHKWNLDFDCDNNFIIWNQKNSINVTDSLSNIANIHLYYECDQNNNRSSQNIIISIKKKRDFNISDFIDMEKERYELAGLLGDLMAWTANIENNRKFKYLLE